jgi:hypothetical protein
MSSDAHLRRDHGTPTSTDPYIDWGPDLPGRYDGGRARVLVANPRALFLTWETTTPPERWRVEVWLGEAHERTVDLAGDASEVWIAVGSNTRGELRLVRDDVHVATLPFETPADGPSADTSERWARIDSHGQMRATPSIGGTALGPEAIAPIAGDGATSSGSTGLQRGA